MATMHGLIEHPARFRSGFFVARLALMVLASSAITFGGSLAGVERACAQTPEDSPRAGVVVQLPGGDASSFCIDDSALQGEGLSGIQALRATGLEVVTKTDPQFGEFVCKIGEVGTEASDCPAAAGSYWAYFRGDANTWTSSETGASQTQVVVDDVDGWVFVEDPNAQPAPPQTEPILDEICAAAATTPEATPIGDDVARESYLPLILIAAAAVALVIVGYFVLRRRGGPA
ncbi:MAG: hypothetical protein ACRDI1_08245 [Actinomycetota bacterium]